MIIDRWSSLVDALHHHPWTQRLRGALIGLRTHWPQLPRPNWLCVEICPQEPGAFKPEPSRRSLEEGPSQTHEAFTGDPLLQASAPAGHQHPPGDSSAWLPTSQWMLKELSGEVTFLHDPSPRDLAAHAGDWLVALAGQEACFHQELSVSLSDPRVIQQVLPFQLEHILPFPPEEAVWSLSTYPLTPTTSRVFVGCIRQSVLQELGNAFRSLGLQLDEAVAPAFAVLAAHRMRQQAPASCLYLWARAGSLTFFFIDETGVRGVRDLALLEEPLTFKRVVQETRKTALYLQAPEGSERCLIGSVERCAALASHFDTPSSASLSPLERAHFLIKGAGQIASQPALASMLFCSRSSSGTLAGSSSTEGKRTRSSGERESAPLNASPHSWSYSWSKCSAALRALQTAALAFTLTAALLSYTSLTLRRRALGRSAEQLLEIGSQHGVQLPTWKGGEGIDAWTQACRESLLGRMNSYPLTPDLPTARDTLAWISDLVSRIGSAQLNSFEYLTEAAPSPKTPSTRYRVKVDLELAVRDLSTADQIQQELLKAHKWIDRPQTLSWKAQKERYKVSFYLRDRTLYAQ